MQKFPTLLTLIPIVAGSLMAQSADTLAPTFEVAVSDAGVEHRLTGSQEPFFGAVIVSLSPRLSPYAPGLPGTLTEFATLGVCYGRGGQTCSFTSPLALVPTDVTIHAQGAILNTSGLQVSDVRDYRLDQALVPAGLRQIVPDARR